LKKKYSLLKELKNNSGFGWDEKLKLPTAPESVWEALIAIKPEAKEFKDKPLPFFED